MRSLLVPICVVFLALAIPVVPFLAFGPQLESWLEQSLEGIVDPCVAALVIVGLLGTDVFLPIPSSVLSTLGGELLGFGAGTIVSFAGLMLGAVLGFGIAKMAGRPLMVRLVGANDVARIDRLSDRMGTGVLIVTRPIPIFAEAAVLFFGATGLTWRRFLLPVAGVNLVIAAGYSALGSWAQLPTALTLSIVIPVLATWWARRAFPDRGPAMGEE